MGLTLAQAEYHHPLDTLTAQEVQDTVHIIRATIPAVIDTEKWVFNWITLLEPEKHLLLPYFLSGATPPPYSIPRKSFTILVERKRNIVTEVVVNLGTRKIETWKLLPAGTQQPFTDEENSVCVDIVKRDPMVQERCREMGFFNMSLVRGSCWNVGYEEDRTVLKTAVRPVLVFMFGQMFDLDNQYGKQA